MYNILSLDGGGSWSILQLLTLKEKFGDINGHEVLQKFDLVIANSGGSIVMAALAENWTLAKALTLFDTQKMREQIFVKNSFKDRFFPVDYLRLFKPFGPKYSAPKKGEGFRKIFPKIDKLQLQDLPKFIGKDSLKLVVCTYDALNNRAKFFKSYGSSDNTYDSIRLTQAIHGASNAPLQYFDFPARFKAKNTGVYYELWDGSLGGFNNPVVAGVIEAFKQGEKLSDIKVVSIGTGNNLMSEEDKERFYKVKQITVRERRKKLKFWRLKYQMEYFTKTILNQAKTILYQPPDWSNYMAMMFLSKDSGEDVSGRFIRLSPMIHIDKNTDDETVDLLKKLYALDMDLTSDKDVSIVKECFKKWKEGKIQNHPIEFKVSRENELIYKTGDKYFAEALAKW